MKRQRGLTELPMRITSLLPMTYDDLYAMCIKERLHWIPRGNIGVACARGWVYKQFDYSYL